MSMGLTVNLHYGWFDIIRKGEAKSRFTVYHDHPEGFWYNGHEVVAGLAIDENGNIYPYIKNITTGNPINFQMQEELLGEGFYKVFMPHRAIRPVPEVAHPAGALSPLPSKPQECLFKCKDPTSAWSLYNQHPLVLCPIDAKFCWACYYNFSPFELKGHFLWVPVHTSGTSLVIPHILQEMTYDFLQSGLTLARNSDEMFFFFNSLHAGATQNHFHFQSVYYDANPVLAINQSTRCKGNGRYELLCNYPINGLWFSPNEDPQYIYEIILKFVKNGIPYNLLVFKYDTYLVARNPSNEVVEEFPFGVFGSMEVAGRMIISNYDLYLKTDLQLVKKAFSKESLSREQILDIVESPL